MATTKAPEKRIPLGWIEVTRKLSGKKFCINIHHIKSVVDGSETDISYAGGAAENYTTVTESYETVLALIAEAQEKLASQPRYVYKREGW